jgi:hypothetical protein
MQPTSVAPEVIVAELLRRADVLAAQAGDAIVAEDEARLADVLDERTAVIELIVARWPDVATARPQPAVIEQLRHATRTTLILGQRVQESAQVTRERIARELSALDARQHASHGYQTAELSNTLEYVR